MLAAPLAATLVLAAPSCSRSAARTLVETTPVIVPAAQSISSEPFRLGPGQLDAVICIALPDGKRAMAATIASGGMAGDIGWLVFVGGPGAYRVSLVRGGYKLGLARLGRDLVETDPVYRRHDPNCCPTGGFDHTRWHWSGRGFTVVRRWHDQSFRS